MHQQVQVEAVYKALRCSPRLKQYHHREDLARTTQEMRMQQDARDVAIPKSKYTFSQREHIELDNA